MGYISYRIDSLDKVPSWNLIIRTARTLIPCADNVHEMKDNNILTRSYANQEDARYLSAHCSNVR